MDMKVIKLDKRHSLYRYGFKTAFKFNNKYNVQATVLKQYLINNQIRHKEIGYKYHNAYYIGVYNEDLIPIILLQLS